MGVSKMTLCCISPGPLLNRTVVADSEFCLDQTEEFYLLCQPAAELYQVPPHHTTALHCTVAQVPATVVALLTSFYVLIALLAIGRKISIPPQSCYVFQDI